MKIAASHILAAAVGVIALVGAANAETATSHGATAKNESRFRIDAVRIGFRCASRNLDKEAMGFGAKGMGQGQDQVVGLPEEVRGQTSRRPKELVLPLQLHDGLKRRPPRRWGIEPFRLRSWGDFSMNMSGRILVAALMLAPLPWLVAPVAAAPVPPLLRLHSTEASGIEAVQYRRGWRGGRHRGGGGVGVGIGLGIAGALIGGAIVGATQPYGYGGYPPGYGYGGPAVAPAYAGDDAVAYCQQRFRSYDPYSGTYTGFDGLRHPCP